MGKLFSGIKIIQVKQTVHLLYKMKYKGNNKSEHIIIAGDSPVTEEWIVGMV